MAGGPQRWEGRSWTVRVAVPLLLVVLAGPLAGTDAVRRVSLLAAVAVLLVTVGQRLRLRWPGPVPTLASLVADLAALAAVAAVEPTLGGPVAAGVLPTTLVHAVALRSAWRWAGLVGAVLVQLSVLAPSGLPAGTVTSLVAVDGVALLSVWLQLGTAAREGRSDREAAEQAGQLTDAVLDGIGEAVVVTDTTGRVVSANGASELTFGAPVRGGCSASLGLHRGAGALDCSRGCPLLGDDGAAAQTDVTRTHPSGRRQVLLANVRALRDPFGRVRQVVHSYRDVTRMKQAEQAKTLFLATASHELKTPVAVIHGFAQLLRDGRLDDEQRATAVERILDRGTQLASIVDRLLLTSRIDGGAIALDPTTIDAVAITRERVEALGPVTERELVLRVPSSPPPAARGDATALATVVDHLVENAVKYSPDGGAIEVAVTADEEHVLLDVADRGVGMSWDDAERCFEPFWQVEVADTRRFGGSGVGLYIVRSLARAMGGDAVVHETRPGAGTTFRITLPRADRTSPEATGPERTGTMIDDFMRQVGVGRSTTWTG